MGGRRCGQCGRRSSYRTPYDVRWAKSGLEKAQAQGELAIKPLLEAVKREELLPGFAKQRHQQIEHWKLYQSLDKSSGSPIQESLTFDSWFTEQLEMLELTDISELEMFSADDFPFEGIPYWEYEDFAAMYPFELYIGDLQLSVEYQPMKKLVYVVYKSGLRKGDPKRWELPRWAGWRVQYKKRVE